jgi:hypothetical protein
MSDRPIILSGLLLFLAGVTFPFWHNLTAKSVRPPDLKTPSKAKQCIAPAAFMKASHMELLAAWREQVVRDNRRTYKSGDGKVYNISLTGTCLKQCHENKAEFCDRCHEYVGLRGPYCWDCHNAPPPAERSGQ